jgi:hypothetical protein
MVVTTAVDSIARARRSLELGPARSLRRELANAAGPFGWALFATVLLSVAAAAAGYDPFLTDTWSRWDSDRYVGLYRTAVVLVPAAPLVARLPAPARVALCAGAILIAAPMAVLFLQKQII